MKLLFIVVLSLLAVSYARGQKKVIILARGWGGGGSYFHGENFKCFETARNAAKLFIL